MTGAPRFLLLAKASNVQLVQTLVPLLIGQGCRAANYKSKQTGQAPKSQAAVVGLQAAAGQGGVCRYFAAKAQAPAYSQGISSRRCPSNLSAMSRPSRSGPVA